MRLPHLDRHGRNCKLELREGGPVPACIAIHPVRQSATYVSAHHGVVLNTAIERLGFVMNDGPINVEAIDLRLLSLGEHATAICIEMMGLGDNLMHGLAYLGVQPIKPVGLMCPMGRKMFRRKEWPSIRRAMREGWPLTFVLSSVRHQRVVAAWTYRMSKGFASALAADFDRHAPNPAPDGHLAVTASIEKAMDELQGEHLRTKALHHEKNVSVTRLAATEMAA